MRSEKMRKKEKEKSESESYQELERLTSKMRERMLVTECDGVL